ncbi:CarD family transcriptional regulator [Bacillus benzoevorans]|uniref:CarD family transcriptional regulator n=1 Tax=Bacillus benzoevorans TaxID=1456 RepID=A0A7X0HQM0_9BACI|nr:CarD family transcriptional regulator [Bacillus benzoevorans]MBB6445068.1 CarD family transcriptional regulator [Bacillus benzoevorans]
MFQIGDKVFYPMHGAGMIKAIEDKEIQGEKQSYCVITIPISHMDVMIPLAKMDQLGVRSVVDRDTMNHILFDFHHIEPNSSLPWKERYRLNLEKLKTGKMSDSAEVVRDLMYQNKEKSLNASEKQMLHQAQRNIISEISMINNISENQAADLLKRSS